MMMNKSILMFILSMNSWSNSIQIPFIDNAFIIPIISGNSIAMLNFSCQQCLCRAISTNAILNCFNNNTCQLFETVPRRYRIESNLGARLYFSQGQLPNRSQCCMPNITEVLVKLQNGTRTRTTINGTRCLLIDSQKRLVVTDFNPGYLRIYNATNINAIMHRKVNFSQPFSLAEQNRAYYIGLQNNSILVIDSNNQSILNIINSPYLNGIRDIIFLNNGQTMVVASTSTRSLVFFKRSNTSVHQYTFSFNQTVTYLYPHGLLRINDSFFYATSWRDNTIYSYSFINQTFWQERLIVNALSYANTSAGYHVRMDECGRIWFALGSAGIHIFNPDGTKVGSYSYSPIDIFDLWIDENYVTYLSDLSTKQLLRIDPNIQCSA